FCYSKNGSGGDCPTTCTGGCETVRHDPSLPYDTIGVTAGAKNIITVGSVAASVASATISDFSSRGPAKDGRIKPEVVARGSSVFSSVPTNSYGRLSGTSMAAPAVTGIAALLVEQWRKTFGGASPTPAQLKAVIIAGADDLGNPGPDYTFGFGLVNAKTSVDTIIADGGTGARLRTLTLAQGQTVETNVVVAAPQKLRFVMHWADPSIPFLGGDDIAQKALVNDLDIRVIGPDGTTHLPWVLSKTAFRDNATRGVNTTDNVEMIEIANAAAGTYRVIATGTSVTEGPQTAVLVASASLAAPPPPCVDPQEIGRTNNSAETAVRGLVAGSEVRGAICTAGDLDFYTFTVTKPGDIYLDVATTGDTEIRFSIDGNGIPTGGILAPNNATRIPINGVTTYPRTITVTVDSRTAPGQIPTYSFTPVFGQAGGARRRSVGR
ncbi:MAG TPA: S8 family serine peptidase, partial [Thermoanaerobaculia bacterium]